MSYRVQNRIVVQMYDIFGQGQLCVFLWLVYKLIVIAAIFLYTFKLSNWYYSFLYWQMVPPYSNISYFTIDYYGIWLFYSYPTFTHMYLFGPFYNRTSNQLHLYLVVAFCTPGYEQPVADWATRHIFIKANLPSMRPRDLNNRTHIRGIQHKVAHVSPLVAPRLVIRGPFY